MHPKSKMDVTNVPNGMTIGDAINAKAYKRGFERRLNMIKQIRFLDKENNVIHGGIRLDNGDVICGCCGGLIESDEFDDDNELLDEYDTWVSLDEEIIGD